MATINWDELDKGTDQLKPDMIAAGNKTNQARSSEIAAALEDKESEANKIGSTIAQAIIGEKKIDTTQFSPDVQGDLLQMNVGESNTTGALIDALGSVVSRFSEYQSGNKYDLFLSLPQWSAMEKDTNAAAVGTKRAGLQQQLTLLKSTLYHVADRSIKSGDWDNGIKALGQAGCQYFDSNTLQVPEWLKTTIQQQLPDKSQMYDEKTHKPTPFAEALADNAKSMLNGPGFDQQMSNNDWSSIGIDNIATTKAQLSIHELGKDSGSRSLADLEAISTKLNSADLSKLSTMQRLYIESIRAKITVDKSQSAPEGQEVQGSVLAKERENVHGSFSYILPEIMDRAKSTANDQVYTRVLLNSSHIGLEFDALTKTKGNLYRELEERSIQQAKNQISDAKGHGMLATLMFVDAVNSDPGVYSTMLKQRLAGSNDRSTMNGEWIPGSGQENLPLLTEKANQTIDIETKIVAMGIFRQALKLDNQDTRLAIMTKACEVMGPDSLTSAVQIVKKIGNEEIGVDTGNGYGFQYNLDKIYSLLESDLPYDQKTSVEIDTEIELALQLHAAFNEDQTKMGEFRVALNKAKLNIEAKCTKLMEGVGVDTAQVQELTTQAQKDLISVRTEWGRLGGLTKFVSKLGPDSIAVVKQEGVKPSLKVAESTNNSLQATKDAMANQDKLDTIQKLEEAGSLQAQVDAVATLESTLTELNASVFEENKLPEPKKQAWSLFGGKKEEPKPVVRSWQLNSVSLQAATPQIPEEIQIYRPADISENQVAEYSGKAMLKNPSSNPYELARQIADSKVAAVELAKMAKSTAELAQQFSPTGEVAQHKLIALKRRVCEVVGTLSV
ncbi:MAG: hypothetical protein WCL07_01720 [bacterium]